MALPPLRLFLCFGRLWVDKAERVLSQERCEVTCFNPGNGTSSKHYFVLPERGQEATVQNIYGVCTSVLTADHFSTEYGIAELADWWPSLLYCNTAEV